ncbi:MAG: ROK family protein [Christensenella sp.]
MDKNHNVIGLDIGGTKCAVTLGNLCGEVLLKKACATDITESPNDVMQHLLCIIDEILQEQRLTTKDISAVGISCGGPLNSKDGIIMSPPNLPLWDNVKITDFFNEKLGVPTFLQNDANACALAEWRFGAGRGTTDMIFLTFGTGLGAGLILNGNLYCGKTDLAGEVGHISLSEDGPIGYGKKGSFEGFCSGAGIKKQAITAIKNRLSSGRPIGFAAQLAHIEDVSAKDVCIAAENKDEFAIEIIDECAEYLGRGIAVLIDVLNPEMIVIGSVYARSENIFREKTQKAIDKYALSLSAKVCRICAAELTRTEQLGDIAALTVAAEGLRAQICARNGENL